MEGLAGETLAAGELEESLEELADAFGPLDVESVAGHDGGAVGVGAYPFRPSLGLCLGVVVFVILAALGWGHPVSFKKAARSSSGACLSMAMRLRLDGVQPNSTSNFCIWPMALLATAR